MPLKLCIAAMAIFGLVFKCDADGNCEARLSAVQEALIGSDKSLVFGDSCSKCQGRDGKRGSVGPPGPIGDPGPKGEPGICKCNLDVIQDLRRQLQALEDFRRKVSDYGDICYAGISTGVIPISHVSATSTHPTCSFGDISLKSSGTWCAETNNDRQYIQVDLQRSTAIYGVLTRGRSCCNQWVVSYKVSFGDRPTRRMPFYRERGSVKVRTGNDFVFFNSCLTVHSSEI